MKNNIHNLINQYICSHILKQPTRSLELDEPLISSGLIDSLSLVDLALFIEEEFNVRIEDSELNRETFDNLKQLVSLIEQKQ
jgi:acyl carrier protein